MVMAVTGCAGPRSVVTDADLPPVPMREFRGAWVATVANIDWPSKPGLSAEAQQAELIAILDKAVALNLNAIVLQVRPAGDALYASELEPWSAFLSGEQGVAPEPAYDPLAFAVAEAHSRGLELHAWFNPYRVGHPSYKGALADTHIANTRPDLVREYGPLLWLDPGHPDVQQHSLDVILDVVRRYDIDGVHLDDYFYPYPREDDAGKPLPFPDDETYQAYLDGRRWPWGALDRNDWRRRNVDDFVKRLYRAVKREKPYVKVGISPFGIWKPGDPPWIVGMNQYETIYADARKWLREGWCDYFTPQLYWPIANPDQSYLSLLAWWREQNPRGRHVWPGLAAYRTESGKPNAIGPREIQYQIEWSRLSFDAIGRGVTRDIADPGHVLFSFKSLMTNQGGLADTLGETVYREPALAPASRWLGGRRPPPPILVGVASREAGRIELRNPPDVTRWSPRLLVQVRRDGVWHSRVVHDTTPVWSLDVGEGEIDRVVVRAMSRTGVLSHAVSPTLDQAE